MAGEGRRLNLHSFSFGLKFNLRIPNSIALELIKDIYIILKYNYTSLLQLLYTYQNYIVISTLAYSPAKPTASGTKMSWQEHVEV